ncbi:MAG: hypothetical protein U0105_06725 [Candidatus Obscuribacterales bacterium]
MPVFVESIIIIAVAAFIAIWVNDSDLKIGGGYLPEETSEAA